MADSLDEVIKVSKLLGFDYSRFENTKLAAEKRKTGGETNKTRGKKILVSPLRASRSVSESSKSKSGEKFRSSTPDIERKGSRSRPTFEKGNIKTSSSERLYNSGRKSVDPEKLIIAQLRKSKSETKNKSRAFEDINQSKNDMNGTSEGKILKSAVKEKPLREIRRKLDFENDEIGDEVTPLPYGLDFTDKLAALRTLISRDRETKDITDRRAYYGEYKSSQRKVIISRSDSLKENQEINERHDLEKHKIRDTLKARKLASDRQRKVQSADLFRDKVVNNRISAAEFDVLQERLETKNERREKKDQHIFERKGTKDHMIDKCLTADNSLLHASNGRKILVASSRKSMEKNKFEPMEEGSRPSSRLESKETQTNQLNQSIRSVQSNVPFYQPVGRPASAPILNCGISVEKRRIIRKNRDIGLEGIEAGLYVNNVEMKSPCRDDRQTNAGDFIGTSLTPEKSKCRSHDKDRNKLLEKNIGSLNRGKRNTDRERQRHDPGNHRPSSRTSHIGEDILHVHNSSGKKYEDSENQSNSSNAVFVHKLCDGKHEKTDTTGTRKSERKVREWIKSQEKLMAKKLPDGMVMEELNVSISIPACSPIHMHPSISDSCDKIPVKLERPRKENSNSLHSNTAYGIIQPHKGDQINGCSSRQAIFDRLEHITMAVVTQQHQLELEIPVKDIQLAQEARVDRGFYGPEARMDRGFYGPEAKVSRGMAGKPAENSDSASTESSVFSLPFSIRSGESVSSTCQAVKLLRKLYNVDTETRQNLVLMAKCFRRWFNNVLYAKARNMEITQAAKRVSPVSYGVMLRKGDTCYRTNVLLHYFNIWKTASRNAELHRKVFLLHRRHTLQKGMNAFKWAINRSKLQQGILQDRVSMMLLQSIFTKWKCRTLENRHLRLQQAFLRWRQFTKEAQKVRMLRNQSNKRLKERVFVEWHTNYQTHLKQHKADTHARRVLLSQAWLSWRCYTSLSKEKKQRETLAVQLFQTTIQRKMFSCMKVEFSKYSVAKQFHKVAQLKVALLAWRAGTEISQTERAEDMRVAEICWSRTSLRSHFTAWRDSLLTNKACRMCDSNLTRNAFYMWKRRYEELVERRQAVDRYIRQKILTRAFQHWYTFVVVMKQRRVAAVKCLQSVLQRRMFDLWHWYTAYQRTLRKRLLLHVRKHNLDTQRRCLSVWKSHFRVRCDEKRAQQLWSNSCARKAAEFWRLVCHKRRLARLLIDTEPVRQLNTQRVYFLHWKERFELILEEKQEASDVRATLDHSKLKLYFEKWHTNTRQCLLIKPMVQRYRQRLVMQCFNGWHQYMVHKAACIRSEQALLQVRLRNKFKAWRRQYQIHQIEKDFNKKLLQDRALRCLHGWRSVIQRKHKANQFHEKHLVKTTFLYWSTLALRRLREKRLQKMEMETVMGLLQKYFIEWREKMYIQQAEEEDHVIQLQQQIQTNKVKVAFYFWRRHFRATLIARENEKIQIRKLAKQALQVWYLYTQNSLQEAVEKFAAGIGLHQDNEEACIDHDQLELDSNSDDKSERQMLGKGESMEILNFDLEMTPRSGTPRTPRTPCTPRTPRTPRASAFGTPLRRLYSPSPSRQSLTQSLEFDAGVLTSSSFIDARFEMEHAVKIESRREIVVTVVNRLRHWPVSIVFEQWKEYTAQQLQFKRLTTQMVSVRQELALKQYYNSWVQYYKEMKLAKQHYEQVLQHKALLSLILYRNSCREKQQLNAIARSHYARKVYTSVFPMWLAKAQEKQHAEKIVYLWTNITDEERQLIPRERSFHYKLNKKSLKQCFTTWQNKYRKISKLKRVYHKILYERYFGAWCNWALERSERRLQCEQFRDNRRKKLVFKIWCLRHRQKKEVERRYKDSRQSYLTVIVQSWHQWAHDQRKRKLMAAYVTQTRQYHLVSRMFTQWKMESDKHRQVTQWYNTRLTTRVLYAWQSVAVWQKDLKQKQIQCQLLSYTALAKRMLRQWYTHYQDRLRLHEQHEQVLQCKVLFLARRWRKKAQKTRSQKLYTQFQNQNMGRMFARWKVAYRKNLDRYDTLEVHLNKKHQELMSHCLETWRTELMCIQAQRVFSMKLLSTFILGWKMAAKGCRQRREVLQKHIVRKDQNAQRVYFLYWYNVAKARKSIRGHANLKIQLAVFKSWLVYTRKKNNLRRLESAFTRKRNLRLLQKHWYLLKTRFDYCIELSDMASRVIHDKNTALMTQALQHWQFRLKIVIADECHEHILAKRTARRWRQFVLRKGQERQHMKEQIEKAVNFHNRYLCNKVYHSWLNEVLATRQAEKRKTRLCRKYGLLWKHKTDMVYTAKCVRREYLYKSAWRIWHLEFVRRKAVKKVEAFEKKQQLTMVFVSWKNLCRKRARKISMIPLPVSPAYNMPSVGSSGSMSPAYSVLSVCSSGSSTPTEELYSPVFNKPSQVQSQIPVSNSVMKRKKSLSARNSPTGSVEKLSTYSSGRRGSIY